MSTTELSNKSKQNTKKNLSFHCFYALHFWYVDEYFRCIQCRRGSCLFLSSSVFHITRIWRKVNVFIFCTIKIKHLLLLSLIMNVKRNIFVSYIIFVPTKKLFVFSQKKGLLLFFFDSSRDYSSVVVTFSQVEQDCHAFKNLLLSPK